MPAFALMTRFVLFLLLIAASPAFAQTPDSTAAVDMAEVQPELIGGLAALQQGIVYPESARRDGVQGRVIVQFVVDESGTPILIETIRGVRADLDSTAMVAVRAARFTPGRQDGRPVKVRFTLPVTFRLNDDPADSPSGPMLGSSWQGAFTADADSGSVVDGNGSLLYRIDADGIEQAVLRVEGGILVETVTTAQPGAPQVEAIQRIAAGLASIPGVTRRTDGYFHAVDLTAAGQPSASDVRIDPGTRTMRLRLPRCRTSSSAAGCVTVFPMLVGGTTGVIQRATYDRAVRQPIPAGRIVLSFTVGPDGRVIDAEVQSNSFGDTVDGRTIADGLIRSLRESSFVVDPGLQPSAEPVRLSLPFEFQTQG